MYGFKTEPVLISALVAALMIAAVEFGLPITEGQQTAVQTLIAAVLAIFARSQVFSQATIEKAAGPDAVDKIAEAASDTSLTMNVVSKTLALLLALALFGAGCAHNPNPTATPDKVVSQAAGYGTKAVQYVTAAQRIVNTYAVAQGGRTPETDKISIAIRDQVIPQAERLKQAFNVYAIASNAVALASAEQDIRTQLDSYEQLVRDVLKTNVPEGLASSLFQTVGDIEDLIREVRLAFNPVVADQRLTYPPGDFLVTRAGLIFLEVK